MIFDRAFLEHARAEYQKMALVFSKEDKRFNSGKDTFRGRMTGFLTPEYYRRDKLFLSSSIVYGYTFKSHRNSYEVDFYPTWVLTSPEGHFIDHPEDFALVADALAQIDISNKKIDRKLRDFNLRLSLPQATLHYVEVPAVYTNGHLVFVSIVPYRKNHLSSLRHGLNLFMASKEISKEIFYLPQKYFTPEYNTYYFEGEQL